MKKRRVPLLIGGLLILFGIGLVLCGSVRHVQILVDGESRRVRTLSRRAGDILRGAGIEFSPEDQILPGVSAIIGHRGRISLNRAITVTLDCGAAGEPLRFISHQHFGGNILLDAGLRMYPGDRLLWDGQEIRPDFNLTGVSALNLRLERADVFTLVTEDHPDGTEVYGSGKTVRDALRSAGYMPGHSQLVLPGEETSFQPGMTVALLPIRELTVSKNGQLTRVVSAGATVGEALARAGLPLMGSDVSIPAAGERLPEDGRILIVPVSERFRMNAEVIHRQTEWSGNAELDLDDTRLLAEGSDGLRGSFTRTRTENGQQVLEETSPETVLVEPVNERREYGTKITVRTLDTPEGPVEYYRAVSVYATSYSPCRSGTAACITGTASGMKVQKGVVAVTSGWYNQFGGQSVYVPDYGRAVIADVGGGIPGRRWIDLGYEDDNFEGWSRETTLYFLTPVPADMVWVLQ